MRNKKWIFWFVTLCAPTLTLASQAEINDHCLLLGTHPSLIVKFANFPSSKHGRLPAHLLQQLTSTKATFIQAKAMSGDAFIVSFKPSTAFLAKQPTPACYQPHEIDALIDELTQHSNVIYATPNLLMKTAQLTSTSLVPVIGAKQWDLKNPPGGMDVQTAYNTTTGSANAIVAVLDTGILPNLSLAPNALSGVTFNNGGSYANGASPSCDATCGGYDHGTHVSGTVAASGTLAYTENIYGVAPTSKVLPVNVFTKFTDPLICGGPSETPCLLAYNSDQINAFNWLSGTAFSGLITAPNITTINMSLGGSGTCSAPFQDAINNLLSMNISFAIAAGNDNTNAAFFTPANCSGVMAIAATGPDGYGSFYSNFGNIVAFAAPGGNSPSGAGSEIYSTIANGYGYKQGTSMASPHIAGLSALLYSVDPTLTPTLVTNIIGSTATAFPVGGPGDSCTPTRPCGTGIANANAAVLAAVSQAPVLTWTPNISVTPGASTALVQWSSAAWNPARTTAFSYTINVNGSDVAACTNVLSTTCTVPGLLPEITYTLYVKASDYRNILTPTQSGPVTFTTGTFTAPTLTVAVRNPLLNTQAFIYYSSLSNVTPDTYTVNNLSSDASVTFDSAHQRFVVSGINTPRRVNNVSITVTVGSNSKTSNSITIPSIL